MIDYLDVYTRLCLHNFSDILVTYYSTGGNKITKKVMLVEISGFDYIDVKDKNDFYSYSI